MEYRDFGNTGIRISRLGFGAMRLPEKTVKGKNRIDRDAAIAAILESFKYGVNYIDSAWGYHDGESEVVVGEALRAWKGHKVYTATKSPGHIVNKPGDYRRILETQLKRLKMDSVDFYHFHGIGYKSLLDVDKKGKWIKAAEKAKSEGLINNISFSIHSGPKDIKKLVDMGLFASLLCQYNLLDQENKEGIAYAKEKGVGTVIMGPCGGSRLTELPVKLSKEMKLPVKNSAELAFRFVFANPDIDCALSGMSTLKMVREDALWASDPEPLTKKQMKAVHTMMKRLKKLSELYCTGCRYCLPCPAEIDIPYIFGLYTSYNVYGMKDYAKVSYQNMGKWPWVPKINAAACTECGACEKKCPQKIKVRAQLKKTHGLLAAPKS